jgi:hypothetical protein
LKNKDIFGFLFGMWILILLGGGIVVLILGPISISGFGDFNNILTSGLKAIVAMGLVVLWIIILSKMKNQIFRKKLNF